MQPVANVYPTKIAGESLEFANAAETFYFL